MEQARALAEEAPVLEAPAPEEPIAGVPVEETEGEDEATDAEAADYEPLYVPETEDDEFLTGPTLRPDEAQFAGATPAEPLSANVRRVVPILQRASEEPGASEQLKRLVAYLLRSA